MPLPVFPSSLPFATHPRIIYPSSRNCCTSPTSPRPNTEPRPASPGHSTVVNACRHLSPTVANRVHISNLAPQTTPSDLVKLFSKAGKVISIHAPLSDGRPLGFAYCQFKNEKAARKAVSKFHAHTLAGHVLSVRRA